MTLQPLLDRSRYSDEEWAYAKAGKCGWYVANYPRDEWCEKPSSPKSFYRYCEDHDRCARDESANYGV